MTTPTLTIEGVSKRFGGVRALDNVDFSVTAGAVHCLVGENGSGKSTLIKIVSGVYKPDHGSITIAGIRHRSLRPREAIRDGIQVIYQDLSVFPNLTVAENIALTPFLAGRRRLFRPAEARRVATSVIDQVNVAIDPDARLSDLPIADRQITAICRALVQDARVLFLDEPTTALTSREVQSLFKVIRELTRRRVAVVFVSHKFNEVLDISEQITVLRNGRIVASGAATEFNRASLSRAMTGHEVDLLQSKSTLPPHGERVLEVVDLCSQDGLEGVSFTVRRGEVLGLTGLLGSGRVEAAEALFGLRQTSGGRILVEGEERRIRSVSEALELGLAYVPGDRLTQGLFLEHSVAQNLVSSSSDTLPRRRGLVTGGVLAELARDVINKLRIKTPSPWSAVGDLSGGNQQRVVLGKWLMRNPKMLILNGPTVGVDIGSRQEILRLLQALSKGGTSLIIVSDDVPELVESCHRVLVMRNGRIVAELTDGEVREETILKELTA